MYEKILDDTTECCICAELCACGWNIGEYISPRQAFYTITDEMMNTAYRFRRGWQLRNRLP